MHLEKIQLLNFKNYPECNLQFSTAANVFVGKNGSGKTNLLDAIYSLSFTKSAFAANDVQCILSGQNFFMVKGHFTKEGKVRELVSSVQLGNKKIFREDQQDYQRLSEHIGKYPVVLIAPDDVDLVRESSESRRKFFDSIISQFDKEYLDSLIHYNQVLKQRNSLLKMFQERGAADWIMLDSYDQVLIKLGKIIFERRKVFVEEFLPVFKKFYRFLVDDAEITNLQYVSELQKTDFAEGLFKNRQKDVVLQRTNFGVHRDDYQFTIEGSDLRRLGSQGQQKSFVIALKLSQFEIIYNHKGFKPLLLLDDIFDKLDDFRIARLLDLVKSDFGQLFITDAHPARTSELLKTIGVSNSLFEVEKGNIQRKH